MAAAGRRDEAGQENPTRREILMSIMIQTRRSPAICMRATRPVIAAVDGSVADRAELARDIDSAHAPAARAAGVDPSPDRAPAVRPT
jgi:hypothetical protein